MFPCFIKSGFRLSRQLKSCLVLFRASSNKTNIESWKFPVKPFWKLDISLKNCDVDVSAIDPNSNPHGDQLIIDQMKYENIGNQLQVNLQNEEVTIEGSGECSGVDKLTIKTPPAFNLDIKLLGHGNIQVSSLECDSVKTKTELGSITLNSIKGLTIEAESLSGNISSSKILQGNVNAKSHRGKICFKKLQGTNATLESCSSLSVEDVYVDELYAKCDRGNILMKSLHGNSKLLAEKDVEVGTIEGSLSCTSQNGNIDVHVVKHSGITLNSLEGNVKLSTAPDLQSSIDMKAQNIDSRSNLESNVKTETEDGITKTTSDNNESYPLISILAPKGEMELKTLSWMERISKFR